MKEDNICIIIKELEWENYFIRERDSMIKNKQKNLNSEEHRKLQLIELELLEEVDRICDKYNIQYILDSGSLLGAVRHKGFIPWDDDADISMTRSEYEKFCKVCTEELKGSNFFFQNDNTDKHYRWGYGKLIRTDTVFVRLGQEHLKMAKGVFIDIFPMDGVRENYFLWKLQHKFCWLARKIMYSEVGKINEENIKKRIGYKIINLISVQVAFKIIGFYSKRMRESEHVNCLSCSYSDVYKKQMKRRYYQERSKIEFEGKEFWAPKDKEGYLKTLYGETYMHLPPKEKRQGHAAASYIDFGNFYNGNEKNAKRYQ